MRIKAPKHRVTIRAPRKQKKTAERGYGGVWRNVRAVALAELGPYCQRCLAVTGRFVPFDEVHHIQPISKRPDLMYETSNLMPLCQSCHKEVHRQYGLKKPILLEGG